MFCSFSGVATEPPHVTIMALQVSLPADIFCLGVTLLAESFLSSLRRLVCSVLCSVGLCMCVFWLGAALPRVVESGVHGIATRVYG